MNERADDNLLISAYVDGELTADERAHVEQLLTTNAAARQLVDELRALRAGLQQLPQHKLGADFAQQVLAKASEMQKAEGPPRPVNSKQKAEDAGTPHSRLPIPHLSSRGFAWSLLAIAAAILILVTSRQEDRNRQVAQGPAPARKVENVPVDGPTVSRAPAAGQPEVSEFKGIANAEKPASAAASPAAMPPAADLKAQDSSKLADELRPLSATGSLQPGRPAIVGEASDFSAKLSASQPAVDAFAKVIAAGDLNLMVVRVDLSPEAAERGEFDKLLATNHIALEDQSRAGALRGRALKELPADKNAESNLELHRNILRNEPTTEAENLKQKILDQAAGDKLEALGKKADALSSTTDWPFDAVLVDASPEQIDATVSALRDSPLTFSSVTITEAGKFPARNKEEVEKKRSLEGRGGGLGGRGQAAANRDSRFDSGGGGAFAGPSALGGAGPTAGEMMGRGRRVSPSELSSHLAEDRKSNENGNRLREQGEQSKIASDRAPSQSMDKLAAPTPVTASPEAASRLAGSNASAPQGFGGGFGSSSNSASQIPAAAPAGQAGRANLAKDSVAATRQRVLFLLRVVEPAPAAVPAKP